MEDTLMCVCVRQRQREWEKVKDGWTKDVPACERGRESGVGEEGEGLQKIKGRVYGGRAKAKEKKEA